MEQYTYFAKFYDRMMENIPYEAWEQYLLMIMFRYGVKPGAKIAELGCGTGVMTRLLHEGGFRMTGVDLSAEMLKIARRNDMNLVTNGREYRQGRKLHVSRKRLQAHPNSPSSNTSLNDSSIRYVQMDMRNLWLPDRQDVIISICDSMNYLITDEDLYLTLRAAKENLVPGGLVIFDLKTEYFFRYVLDGKTWRGRHRDFSYVWRNRYDPEKKIHTYQLTFDGKYSENHRQRAFSAEDIKKAALRAGFQHARVFAENSFEKPRHTVQKLAPRNLRSPLLPEFRQLQSSMPRRNTERIYVVLVNKHEMICPINNPS